MIVSRLAAVLGRVSSALASTAAVALNVHIWDVTSLRLFPETAVRRQVGAHSYGRAAAEASRCCYCFKATALCYCCPAAAVDVGAGTLLRPLRPQDTIKTTLSVPAVAAARLSCLCALDSCCADQLTIIAGDSEADCGVCQDNYSVAFPI